MCDRSILPALAILGSGALASPSDEDTEAPAEAEGLLPVPMYPGDLATRA